jgi:hypothetical protein
MPKENKLIIIERRIRMLKEYREYVYNSFDLNLIDNEIIELRKMLEDFKQATNPN